MPSGPRSPPARSCTTWNWLRSSSMPARARSRLDRPGLQRALAMLKAGEGEALLGVKLDRLTRSVVDLGTLVERYFVPGKAALLSVGEQIDTRSAAGRLVLNVLASVSQWEREAIGE